MISFAKFLALVHEGDVKPYPWQARLARSCAQGTPPSRIVVPTGAGKTMTVDALVWALARQADRPAALRTIGVRIVWVIDRRILVDEVHEHAKRLVRLLEQALDDPADPLHDLAARLSQLSGAAPLVATRWRGGLQGRPERCGPLQPQIITSTIAQIGSRLLFRGYGVGSRSLAIEAGLAACDTTICLDEAHLAEPFQETVEAIRAHREASEDGLALPGLRTITLTATPQRAAADVLTLDDRDEAALRRRFTGEKQARLIEPQAGADESARVDLLSTIVAGYVREGSPSVACVLNTVRRARAVFDALRKELGDTADVILLVGPQRSADRDRILAKHYEVLFGSKLEADALSEVKPNAGAPGEGNPQAKPLVCVATQTFEVGLDADVAAMVCESASATALIQRLGRLNRRGETAGRATIVRDEGSWLYAEEEPATWSWLQGLAGAGETIDVSVAALARNPPFHSPRISHAATLTAEIVELFAQTSPLPASWCEPDPEVFLRGQDAKPAAELTVCWRSDLRPDLTGQSADRYRAMLLQLAPPQRQELVTLSMTAARALLAARYPQAGSPARAGLPALYEADVEDTALDPVAPEPQHERDRLAFLVLRGETVHRGVLSPGNQADDTDVAEPAPIWPSALRPGDILILPTCAGGADENGLAPLQPRHESATDVAADRRPNGQPAPVRLTPEALADDGGGRLALDRWRRIVHECGKTDRAIAEARGPRARRQLVDKLIERLGEAPLLGDHPGLELLAPAARERSGWDVLLRSIGVADVDDVQGLDGVDEGVAEEHEAVDAKPRRLERAWVLLPVRAELTYGYGGRRHAADVGFPPTLDMHARAVSEEVSACTERLQLAPRLSSALVLAARAHDHGKADPRTQAFYRRGVNALAATPIAKSEFGTRDPRSARISAQLAGLPKRQRHEIASVAVLEQALASGAVEADGLDCDLALHGVATHQGRGRPIPDVPIGGRPSRPFSIDAAGVAGAARGDGRDGWADGAWLERFWLMFERYGAWGMAYLEALLVLSDRVVSSRGQ